MATIKGVIVYSITFVFSLVALYIYILGASRYLTNVEENTCDMTYIFEYPQYVRIALDREHEESFPRYSLYVYGEGYVTKKHRKKQFSGIPVLFIPGNAGSHEQVRSLASVSLRKSIKDRTPFHFDFFTVSLGNDYSALYGGLLMGQARYVALSIEKILSFYNGSQDKVVLIGHSMGGVVAKGALVINEDSKNATVRNNSAANILITLAAPHEPIFLPDPGLVYFYETLFKMYLEFNTTGMTIVSIGGGRRDILVSSLQTFEPGADLNVISSGIPDVWKSTDHLCILWCKQLVLTIVRGLFDSVDTTGRVPKITSDPEVKYRALSYHFTNRVYGKKMIQPPDTVKFERGGKWIEDFRKQYVWSGSSQGNSEKTVYLMIRVGDGAFSYDTITIDTVNLETPNWIFACSAHSIQGDSRTCEWGWNLTNRTSISPDPLQRRHHKGIDIQLSKLRGWKVSHIVVRIPAEEWRGDRKKSPVKVMVDLYKRSERTLRLRDSGISGMRSLIPASKIFSPNPSGSLTTFSGAVRYYVELFNVEDAINVEFEPQLSVGSSIGSPEINSKEVPQAIFEIIEPSSLTRGDKTTTLVRTLVADVKANDGGFMKKRLSIYLTKKNVDAELKITLEPEYSYRIVVRRAGIIDRVTCLVRDGWPHLYLIIISLCLLAIVMRLDPAPLEVTMTIGITLFGIWLGGDIFTYLVAFGILHVFAIAICFFIIFCGSIAYSTTAKFVARIFSIPALWLQWILSYITPSANFLNFVIVVIGLTSSGAAVMVVTVPFYFLKLTKMYDDYLEELFMASLHHYFPRLRKRKRQGNAVASSSDDTKEDAPAPDAETKSKKTKNSAGSLFNHLLLFVTWCFLALPAIPAALVWAKNFRYETRLSTEDPCMICSWLLLSQTLAAGKVMIPSKEIQHEESKIKYCAVSFRLGAWLIQLTAMSETASQFPVFMLFLVAMLMFGLGQTSGQTSPEIISQADESD